MFLSGNTDQHYMLRLKGQWPRLDSRWAVGVIGPTTMVTQCHEQRMRPLWEINIEQHNRKQTKEKRQNEKGKCHDLIKTKGDMYESLWNAWIIKAGKADSHGKSLICAKCPCLTNGTKNQKGYTARHPQKESSSSLCRKEGSTGLVQIPIYSVPWPVRDFQGVRA